MTVKVPGERRGPNSRRKPKATVYEAATVERASRYQYPLRGSVVPPALTSSAPTVQTFGAPSHTSSAPPAPTEHAHHPTEENPVSNTLNLTLSPDERDAVLQTLAAMRAVSAAPEADRADPPGSATNVVPILRAARA